MNQLNLPSPSGGKKTRKRVGRGRGTGLGKTSGRGMNGQNSRSGGSRPAWFEGGQMPLIRRIPKRGFTPLERTVYQVVNLSSLEAMDSTGVVTPADLAVAGLIKNSAGLIKILAKGDLTKPLQVTAHAFSASAREKIEKAGGSVTVLDAAKPNPNQNEN